MDKSLAPGFGYETDTGNRDTLESVAVVGFSIRFPEEATSAEAFWNMVIDGRCCSEEFPKDRLNVEAFYNPDTDGQGIVSLGSMESCSLALLKLMDLRTNRFHCGAAISSAVNFPRLMLRSSQ